MAQHEINIIDMAHMNSMCALVNVLMTIFR